jgi:predicted nucleic acid-binding protein
MATYLLDTSVIIDAINDRHNRRQLLRDLLKAGNSLACCPVNVAEIYAGVRPAEEQNTQAFLSTLDYYPISFAIARLSGELKRDFSKKGKTLTLTDTLIAATALHHQLPLLTDNTKDFPMKELTLYPLPN